MFSDKRAAADMDKTDKFLRILSHVEEEGLKKTTLNVVAEILDRFRPS